MEPKAIMSRLQVKFLKALAHPLRIQIIELLNTKELCQCEIIPKLKRSQSTISQHLQILVGSNILQRRQEAQRTLYKVTDPKIKKNLKDVEGIVLDSMMKTSKAMETFRKSS